MDLPLLPPRRSSSAKVGAAAHRGQGGRGEREPPEGAQHDVFSSFGTAEGPQSPDLPGAPCEPVVRPVLPSGGRRRARHRPVTPGHRVAALLALTFAVAAPASAHVKGPGGAAGDVRYERPSASAFAAQARAAEPAVTAPPRADCQPGGIPEGRCRAGSPSRTRRGQGRQGYRCNLTVVGQVRVDRRLPRAPLRRQGRARVRLLRHRAALPDERAEPERSSRPASPCST